MLLPIGDEGSEDIPKANFSLATCTYLSKLGFTDADIHGQFADIIWMHALAIGYSPNYLVENADGIRQNWPRIPLPDSSGLLISSAELGRKVATLLDTENPVSGITTGKIRTELRHIAIVTGVNGRVLDPASVDLAITSGWGHTGKEGVTMPGKGKSVKRDYTSEELAALKAGVEALGLTFEQAIKYLGEDTYDIYLNNFAYWRNIPSKVWDYHIGGYQVIKKWLSYRERELLGRALIVEEVREVMGIARRIVALLLLEPALDENYQSIKNSTYSWPNRED